MNLFLQLQVNKAEGVLERILRVVRFRGFCINQFAAQTSLDDRHMNLTLRLFSNSSGQNLQRQLEKLFEVHSVEVFLESEALKSQTPSRRVRRRAP